MSKLDAIERQDLERISGGQSRTESGELGVETAAGKAKATINRKTEEPSRYIRCLDLVGRQAGLLESPNNVERRQEKLCGPLLAKE